MTITAEAPDANGTTQQWTPSSGTAISDVATNDGDTTYVGETTTGHVQEYNFAETGPAATPSGHMVMAIKFVVVARATVTGATLNLSLRRGLTSNDRRSNAPAQSSFNLTTSYAEYSLTFSNVPFPGIHGSSAAWEADGSNLNDFDFGFVATDVNGGEIRVTQFRADIISRPTVTLDAMILDDKAIKWQWAEIEGIPHLPSTQDLEVGTDWSVGAYYYGFDYRPVAGSLKFLQKFRSGRINHSTGREESDTGRLVLIDVDEVAYEKDANTLEPKRTIVSRSGSPVTRPHGFYSWLLAYGDRTNAVRSRLVDSTGGGANTIKGLDPKDWSGTEGRQFDVTAGEGTNFTQGNIHYIDREAIYVKTISTDTFGTGVDGLERGKFGSMNAPHEYNPQTGVYPFVSNHPTSWNGRWVRLWLNVIDPETGYPFPMSTALATTYAWRNHTQTVGPGKNEYAVQLGPYFEEKLKQPINDSRKARLNRITLDNHCAIWLHEDQDTTNTAPPKVRRITFLPTDTYATINDLLADIQSKVDGITTTSQWAFLMLDASHVTVRSSHASGFPTSINIYGGLSEILGFGDAGQNHTPSNADTAIGTANPFVYVARSECAQVGITYNAESLFLADGDTDDWGSYAAAVIGGTTGFFATYPMKIGSLKDGIVRQLDETTSSSVQTGSDGDFFDIVPRETGTMLAHGVPVSQFGRAVIGTASSPIITVSPTFDAVGEFHNIFLELAISTGFSLSSYDDLPRGLGLGLDQRLFDTTGWEDVSSKLPSNKRSYLLHEPTSLLELIDEELKGPATLVLKQDTQGRITISTQNLPGLSDSPVSVLDEHWLRGKNIQQETTDRYVVNSLEVDCDFNPITGKYETKLVANEPNSIQLYGKRARKTKHRGIRSQAMGASISSSAAPRQFFASMASALFYRWGFELPVVVGSIGYRGLALRPGQAVLMTQLDIADVRAWDTKGVTARAGEIIKIDKDQDNGTCSVEIVTDSRAIRATGYAPSAKVQTWVGGSKLAQCYANKRSRTTDGQTGGTDAGWFTAGDKCVIFEGNKNNPTVDHVTIAAVGRDIAGGVPRDLELTAVPSFTPVDGTIIAWDDYDTLTSAQQAKLYAAIGSSGFIDSGNSVVVFEYSL